MFFKKNKTLIVLTYSIVLIWSSMAQSSVTTLSYDFSEGDDHGAQPMYTDIYTPIFNEFTAKWESFKEKAKGASVDEKAELAILEIGPVAPVDFSAQEFIDADFSHWNFNGGIQPMPDSIEGYGFLVQGNNHSDDAQFGLYIPISPEDFTPKKGANYALTLDYAVAGNSSSLGTGVGGGNTVNLQAVVTQMDPAIVNEDQGHIWRSREHLDLFADTSKTMAAGSNVICADSNYVPPSFKCSSKEKTGDGRFKFELVKPMQLQTLSYTFDPSKPLWLYISGHSSFEGFSSFYFQSLNLKIVE